MSRSILLFSGRGMPLLLTSALIVGTICGKASVFGLSGDPTAWIDLGIVYTAPAGGDAYYPSVIFDASGFGSGSAGFRMWYSDGSGLVYLSESADGLSWSAPVPASGLGSDAHHVQVVFDPDCFGALPCAAGAVRYKIWYWDINANLYSIAAIATAESADGISWSNDQAIAQDPSAPLVTGIWPDWNRGSYGPLAVIYQSAAPNLGSDPWSYRYVMYHDGTDGGHEFTGLGYSADGLFWTAYGSAPVLGGSAPPIFWDCSDAAYGTVYRDADGFHFWYSGGGADDGAGGCQDQPVHEGIGYAASSDGLAWSKHPDNPIFHIDEALSYRDRRVYTPAVVADARGCLQMYYSAQALGSGEPKKIGLAVHAPALADLALAAVASPDPVVAGTVLTPTLTATNRGPDAVPDAAIDAPLPAGTTFQAIAEPTGWTCITPPVGSGGTIRCTAPSFAVGSAAFALDLLVDPATPPATMLSLDATITTLCTDPTWGDNSATTTAAVSTVADLGIAKVGPAETAPGATLAYTITVANQGPSAGAAVEVDDPPPPGLIFVANAGACTTPFPCTLGAVPPGTPQVITSTWAVAPGFTGMIVNTATVQSPTADPAPGDESARSVTQVAWTPEIPALSPWGIAVLVALLAGLAVSTLKR